MANSMSLRWSTIRTPTAPTIANPTMKTGTSPPNPLAPGTSDVPSLIGRYNNATLQTPVINYSRTSRSLKSKEAITPNPLMANGRISAT